MSSTDYIQLAQDAVKKWKQSETSSITVGNRQFAVEVHRVLKTGSEKHKATITELGGSKQTHHGHHKNRPDAVQRALVKFF